MRILLTNDDGIDAQGLAALETSLSPHHEVWVCAPSGERSGASHSIQMRNPVKVTSRGSRRFSCGGTPADCVFLAHRGSFVPPVDLVISGINHGPNLGTDTVYSGTCAAARQAVLLGIPAIAASLAADPSERGFASGAALIAESLNLLLSLAPTGHFLNVNLPSEPRYPVQIQEASPCVRVYRDQVVEVPDRSGDRWCWVDGMLLDGPPDPGTDLDLVSRGLASWTALPAQPAWTRVGERP